MELVGDTGEGKVKTEALVRMLEDAPVRHAKDVGARILKALEEIPLNEVSLNQLVTHTGLSTSTIHYRVRVKWRLNPSKKYSKVFKGASDLYSVEELLKKARGET